MEAEEGEYTDIEDEFSDLTLKDKLRATK